MSPLWLLSLVTICVQLADDPLESATVIFTSADGASALYQTGDDGCVEIDRLAAGTYTLTVGAPGAVPEEVSFVVPAAAPVKETFTLRAVTTVEEEIIVEENREQVGETRRVLQPEIVQKVPGSQGDALKAIQNLPGLARPPAIVGALLVRGASPEDTRVFLDGQEIPLLYHFGGLTSVVATEALSSIDFLPGGFGVRYGRAIGGVVDVETRGSEAQRWGGSADADLYDAAVVAEGPVGTEARYGSVLVAGRRSYVDGVMNLVIPEDALPFTVAPRYYDYQLRYDPGVGPNGGKGRVFLYGSDDQLRFIANDPSGDGGRFDGTVFFRTQFHRFQGVWSRPLANEWVFRLMPGVGIFRGVANAGGGFFVLDSTSAGGLVRAEVSGPTETGATLLFGSEVYYRPIRYAFKFRGLTDLEESLNAKSTYNTAAGAVYAEAEVPLNEQVTLVPGMRVDGYTPGDAFTIDPRAAVRWTPNDRWSVKGYAGVYHQPPDLAEWDPTFGDLSLVPETAYQLGVGAGYSVDRYVQIEAELFWKWLDDLVVDLPSDPATPTIQVGYANDGIGRIYGAEFLVRRNLGDNLYGWIAYTLSKSERASPYVPGGWYPFEFDQTHILTLVAGYDLGRGWDAGVRFRYTTGNPTTDIVGAIYDSDTDFYIPIPGEINGARVPSFNQLDVRFDKTWELPKWKLSAYLDVQNVYNRGNPEGVVYEYNYRSSRLITGLPILPSIGLRGEF